MKKTYIISVLLQFTALAIVAVFASKANSLLLPVISISIFFICGVINLLIGIRKIWDKPALGLFLIIIGTLGALSIVLILSAISPVHEQPKSNSAMTKSDMSNIRAQAEVIYDKDASYSGLCTDQEVLRTFLHLKDIARKNSIQCFSDKDSFVVLAGLRKPADENLNVCIDSSGSIKEITNAQAQAITSSDTLCE